MWTRSPHRSDSRLLLAVLLGSVLGACSRVNLHELEPMPHTPYKGYADAAAGRALFHDTALGGSSNSKSCYSCHKRESELAGSADKDYDAMFGFVTRDIEDVINLCIVLPLKGKPYAKDSQEMADLIAYLRSL